MEEQQEYLTARWMRWSLRSSRRMAAAVWPLRCRDAGVQRSASPSGSGRLVAIVVAPAAEGAAEYLKK
eukprot:scaffold57882_cov61-Phaeocystis_antarctica.AAC.3